MACRYILDAALCLIFISTLTYSQSTDCPDTLTSTEFINYVKTFPACRRTESTTLFRTNLPIVYNAFDVNDKFTGNVDYDAITKFCRSVQSCQTALSSCQGSLVSFLEQRGMGLCMNGISLDADIKEAVSTLSKGGCNIASIYDLPVTHDGCFLGKDQADISNYLNSTSRRRKISVAQDRCNLRYQESQGVCNAESNKAFAKLLAASQDLELMTSFADYINYDYDISGSRSTLSMFGLSHIHQPSGGYSTCSGLSDTTLVWNTRVRIDATFMGITPTSETKALYSVAIRFARDDGVIVDDYMASVKDTTLNTQTSRQFAGSSTPIETEVISENHVLFKHKDGNMKIIVTRYGEALSMMISLSDELLQQETVGLLVDGCEAYGASDFTLVQVSNDKCKKICSSFGDLAAHCEYDCISGLTEAESLYKSLSSNKELVEKIDAVSGSERLLASSLLSLIVTLLLTCVSL